MKILIYRISSIGDIVLTTPVLRCLRKQCPDAEIHYVTRRRYAETLQFNPNIDKLWLVEKSPLEIAALLKAEKFDHFIDLHRNIRSRRLRWILRARYSTFPKLNVKKWLFTKLKINRLPKVHIVDRYFRAVASLNISNDHQGLDFYLPEVKNLPKELLLPDSYIAFAIGGTFFTKRYPAQLIAEFVQLTSWPVVLLGGASELTDAESIVAAAPQKVINLCGKLSLTESAIVIERSSAVVSNDTGMMHVAAAFKKQLVSLWGNTVPAFGMYPYFPAGIDERYVMLENTKLHCRPCSKLGYAKCPKKHFDCMQSIAPREILHNLPKNHENNH